MTRSIVTHPAAGCSPEFPGRVIVALADEYGMPTSTADASPRCVRNGAPPIWKPIAENEHGQ